MNAEDGEMPNFETMKLTAVCIKQMLREALGDDCPMAMTAVQTAVALLLVDLTRENKITQKDREFAYNNFGRFLEKGYDVFSKEPTRTFQ